MVTKMLHLNLKALLLAHEIHYQVEFQSKFLPRESCHSTQCKYWSLASAQHSALLKLNRRNRDRHLHVLLSMDSTMVHPGFSSAGRNIRGNVLCFREILFLRQNENMQHDSI